MIEQNKHKTPSSQSKTYPLDSFLYPLPLFTRQLFRIFARTTFFIPYI